MPVTRFTPKLGCIPEPDARTLRIASLRSGSVVDLLTRNFLFLFFSKNETVFKLGLRSKNGCEIYKA